MNDRYEDGQGNISGTGGEHKRSVSWNSRVRFHNDPDDWPMEYDEETFPHER